MCLNDLQPLESIKFDIISRRSDSWTNHSVQFTMNAFSESKAVFKQEDIAANITIAFDKLS